MNKQERYWRFLGSRFYGPSGFNDGSAKKWGFFLAVTHINHQLREESVHEVAYLKKYCQQHQLPLQVEVWEKPTKRALKQRLESFVIKCLRSRCKAAAMTA